MKHLKIFVLFLVPIVFTAKLNYDRQVWDWLLKFWKLIHRKCRLKQNTSRRRNESSITDTKQFLKFFIFASLNFRIKKIVHLEVYYYEVWEFWLLTSACTCEHLYIFHLLRTHQKLINLLFACIDLSEIITR